VLLQDANPVPVTWALSSPSEAPLSDLTVRVCDKGGLPPDRIVFEIWNVDADVKTVLPSSTRLCDIDLTSNTLVVGFPAQFAAHPVPVGTAPVGRSTDRWFCPAIRSLFDSGKWTQIVRSP
jgi:hypothetical protein